MAKPKVNGKKKILNEQYNAMYESDFSENVSNMIVEDVIKPRTHEKAQKKKLNRLIINSLFDFNGPKVLSQEIQRKFSAPVIDFKVSFYWRWCALEEAYRTLEHAEAFLKRYPSGRSFINKNEYIKYHLEVFFQSLFNLREKLRKFYEATYKDTPFFQNDKNVQIKKFVLSFFQKWVDCYRNPLVHEFESYDEQGLSRLRGLELYRQHITNCKPFSEMLENELLSAASDVKNQRVKMVSEILVHVKQMLSTYFNEIEPLFWDKNKTLIVQ